MIQRSWLVLVVAMAGWLLPVPNLRAAELITLQLETFDNLNNQSIDVDTGLGNNLRNDGLIRCNYLLTGGIEAGDYDRIANAIKPLADRDVTNVPRLCLNSPGGSYQEGMRIAQYLIRENVGTAVPAGAICYSSCSFIFMGGSFPWKGEINRFLHVRGDLGFHAPYLTNLPDQKYDKGVIAEAYAEGIKAMRTLMELGVGSEVKRFPTELMQELMGKGPEQLFTVDTVGKAIRYRIHIYGSKLSRALDKATFCNACVNMKYGAFERYGQNGETDLCANPGEISEKPFPAGKRLIYEVAPRGGTCAVDLTMSAGNVTRWTYVDDESQPWSDGLELAYWYLYPPNTPLQSLDDGAADVSVKAADGSVFAFANTIPASEEKEAGDAAKILVGFVIDDYLGHGKLNHESSAEIFADTVSYYDKGEVPRDQVIADHQRYYSKWPQRKYQVISDSFDVKVRTPQTLEVTFQYAFTVASDKKTVSGIGATELGLEVVNGQFKIVREAGAVLERK